MNLSALAGRGMSRAITSNDYLVWPSRIFRDLPFQLPLRP
jgi:hypothetical protein